MSLVKIPSWEASFWGMIAALPISKCFISMSEKINIICLYIYIGLLPGLRKKMLRYKNYTLR